VKNLYEKQKLEAQEQVVILPGGKEETIEYLTRFGSAASKKSEVVTMHFFLGKEGSPAGVKNDAVIEWIRNTMTGTPKTMRSTDLIKELEETMTRKVQEYIVTSEGPLKVEHREQEYKIKDGRIKVEQQGEHRGKFLRLVHAESGETNADVRIRDLHLGNFISVMNALPSNPYRIIPSKTEIRVEIDFPGLTKELLQDFAKKRAKDRILLVEPSGAGVSITIRPKLVSERRKLKGPVRMIQDWDSDPVRPIPPIKVAERLQNARDYKWDLEDGVLILKFERDTWNPDEEVDEEEESGS